MRSNKKMCVGSGLVGLDIIINDNDITNPSVHVGGSCANVLIDLAFLGLDTCPISRLGDDDASSEITNQLESWGVRTNLVSQLEDGSTPVIIQHNFFDKQGKPKHKFEFYSSKKGKSRWPAFKPVLSKLVPNLLSHISKADVFYFDRANRASIELARHYKDHGALVFFEPSSIGDTKLFEESLKVSNILKFSSERIRNYTEKYKTPQVSLEIQTDGAEGLRYRAKKISTNWVKLSPYSVRFVKDTSGAGDWCSAGIIYSLIDNFSEKTFSNIGLIEEALFFGQALSSINCHFKGARGLMYSMTKDELFYFVEQILNFESPNFAKFQSQSTTRNYSGILKQYGIVI